MKKFLWKFLLVLCVIGLIINPPVGIHGLIWTCIVSFIISILASV